MSPVDILTRLGGLMRVFTVDPAGPLVFWIGLVVALAALGLLARRSLEPLREKAWMLAILPACWIVVGLCGVFFARTTESGAPTGNTNVETALVFGFVAFLLVWVSVIYGLKETKLFAAVYAVINLYFMVGMSVAAYMAVSGIWP